MIPRITLAPDALHRSATALASVDLPSAAEAVSRIHELGAHEQEGRCLVATEAGYAAAMSAMEDVVYDAVNSPDLSGRRNRTVVAARESLRGASA